MPAPPIVHELVDRLWEDRGSGAKIDRIYRVALRQPGPTVWAGISGNVRITTPGRDGEWLRETRPPPGMAWKPAPVIDREP